MPLRRLIRLSSSSRLICLPPKKRWEKKRGPLQLESKRRSGCTCIVHVARWFFAFPIKTNMLSFLLGQSSRVTDAEQPPAPLGDSSVAWRVSQGSDRKFVSNKGASPVTSRSSSSGAPFSRHRLLGGNEVAARLANTSRRKARANAPPSQEAPQQGPIHAHRRNQHRDEHERDPAFKGESECARNAVGPTSPEFSPECTA